MSGERAERLEVLRRVEVLIVAAETLHMPRSEARDFTEDELERAAWANLAIDDPSLLHMVRPAAIERGEALVREGAGDDHAG